MSNGYEASYYSINRYIEVPYRGQGDKKDQNKFRIVCAQLSDHNYEVKIGYATNSNPPHKRKWIDDENNAVKLLKRAYSHEQDNMVIGCYACLYGHKFGGIGRFTCLNGRRSSISDLSQVKLNNKVSLVYMYTPSCPGSKFYLFGNKNFKGKFEYVETGNARYWNLGGWGNTEFNNKASSAKLIIPVAQKATSTQEAPSIRQNVPQVQMPDGAKYIPGSSSSGGTVNNIKQVLPRTE